MTLPPSLLAGAAFLVAGGLSAMAAQTVVRTLEERSVEAVEAQLQRQGYGWASVLGDGLQVVIEGEAPSESARFDAISAASRAVDGARVIDNMRVADTQEIAPPDFALTILRNDGGLSVIGLVPAETPRDDLAADLAQAAPGQDIADLLQTADYPVPDGWEPALAYALNALELLPRAKISVAAGHVTIEAISDSPEEQRRLESELARMAPEEVRLGLAISAPRPVIAPFTLRASLEDGRLAFDACSADSEESLDAIRAAATAAGAEGPIDCRLGLGAPAPDWGPAVATGLGALRDLGAGTLTFSDLDVALVAAPGTDPALFDRVAAELDGTLPDSFALEAQPPAPVAAAPVSQGPTEFTATLLEDGTVRLAGRVEDRRMGDLARAFAQARFGAGDVIMAARPGAAGLPSDLPSDWTMRVLTGIEALSRLHDGTVTVAPDAITVSGRSGDRAARDTITARAVETLDPDAALRISVTYDEALDPLAALPTPEECLAKITSVTDAAKITFDPGSATISADGEPVIEAIAEILRSCPDLRLRIAGYTDSQGREETNLRLSQDRADAVLSALRGERVPVMGFEAQGFGEADPIASNDTETGREANRRIEFTLLGATPPDEAGLEVASPGETPATPGDTPAPEDAPRSEPVIEQPDSPPIRPEEVEQRAAEVLAAQPEAEEPAAPDAAEDEASPAPEGDTTAAEAAEPATDDAAASASPEPDSAAASDTESTPPAGDAAEASEAEATATAEAEAGDADANPPAAEAEATTPADAPEAGQPGTPAETEDPSAPVVRRLSQMPASGAGQASVPTTGDASAGPALAEAEPAAEGATSATTTGAAEAPSAPAIEQPDAPPPRPAGVESRAAEEASRLDPAEALAQIGPPAPPAEAGPAAAPEEAATTATAIPAEDRPAATDPAFIGPPPPAAPSATGLAPAAPTAEEPPAEGPTE
jgi:OOP family OmpA-OmpF porin